ncbi:zinc knuckle [Ostertagia ostertagi]
MSAKKFEKLLGNCKTTLVIQERICEVLDERGIDSEDEWDRYIATMEKDGEVLATVCDILNSNTLQVVSAARDLKARVVESGDCAQGEREEKRACEYGNANVQMAYDIGRDNGRLQAPPTQWTGAVFEPRWRQCVENYLEGPNGPPGQCSTMDMINCFQSLSCVDPGVYKGKVNENFKEFIRRFRRKYQRVVVSDQTLIEILGDDHLGGRAKSVFLSLPMEVRNRGFEAVVEELGKLLADDCVAGRMRAIAELRELRIRPQQEVADFCVALEKLGRKANPRGSIEDNSLEYAHILLSNLKQWPEHVQLLSVLHKARPEKAYEEVKQLALSIELSKRIYGGTQVEREDRHRDWKTRARSYKSSNLEVGGGRTATTGVITEVARKEVDGRVDRIFPEKGHAHRFLERRLPSDSNKPRERNSNDGRKCFNCSKFGHIAKECTQRTQVKRIKESQVEKEPASDDRISLIVQKARSMGVRLAADPRTTTALVGRRMSGWARVLDTRIPALLDAGSMISIVRRNSVISSHGQRLRCGQPRAHKEGEGSTSL